MCIVFAGIILFIILFIIIFIFFFFFLAFKMLKYTVPRFIWHILVMMCAMSRNDRWQFSLVGRQKTPNNDYCQDSRFLQVIAAKLLCYHRQTTHFFCLQDTVNNYLCKALRIVGRRMYFQFQEHYYHQTLRVVKSLLCLG